MPVVILSVVVVSVVVFSGVVVLSVIKKHSKFTKLCLACIKYKMQLIALNKKKK